MKEITSLRRQLTRQARGAGVGVGRKEDVTVQDPEATGSRDADEVEAGGDDDSAEPATGKPGRQRWDPKLLPPTEEQQDLVRQVRWDARVPAVVGRVVTTVAATWVRGRSGRNRRSH